MGSSYRQDLKSGDTHDWESKLREACAILENVSREIFDVACDEDQTDNAADDGGLAEALRIAARIIKDLLPKDREA